VGVRRRAAKAEVNVMRSSQHLAGWIPLAVDFSETETEGQQSAPNHQHTDIWAE
jgi:hypothetical protein